MDKLYHYTNFNGLKGILESQCLWATHFRFLNDSSEVFHSKEKLFYNLSQDKYINQIKKDILEHEHLSSNNLYVEAPNENWFKDLIKAEVNILVDILYNTNQNLYIASFCKHSEGYNQENGLLSQWRGYGEDGGFAIEFDREKLNNALKKEFDNFFGAKFPLMDVDYSNNLQKFSKKFKKELDIIEPYIRRMIVDRFFELKSPSMSDKMFESIFTIMVYHKHHAFSEEKEFRLVILLQNNYDKIIENSDERKPEKIVKFREKKGSLVPYIELFKNSDANLSIDNLRQSNISLPINRIIVGPHKDKDNRSTLLQQILRNTHIKVCTSDIPYISF